MMKTKRVLAQPMPEEVVARLVDFVARKFYPGRAEGFAKDRPRILEWVILWPASWLYKRGVTLPTQRYEALLTEVLMDALRFGDFASIKYLPGYLRSVVEKHFAHHGDEIYEEAKVLRRVTEAVLLTLGPAAVRERDGVAEMVRMAKLLKATKGRKPPAVLQTKQKELF